MERKPTIHPFIIISWCALAASLTLIIIVYFGGQTFGQRAAEKYSWGSPEWKREVERLSSK